MLYCVHGLHEGKRNYTDGEYLCVIVVITMHKQYRIRAPLKNK